MWFHNLFLSVPKVTKLVLFMSHCLDYLDVKYTTISFPKSILTKTLEIHVEATYYLLTTNHYKICCHNFVFRVPRERKILSLHFAYFIHCHDNSEKIYTAITHTGIAILWKQDRLYIMIYWAQRMQFYVYSLFFLRTLFLHLLIFQQMKLIRKKICQS